MVFKANLKECQIFPESQIKKKKKDQTGLSLTSSEAETVKYS